MVQQKVQKPLAGPNKWADRIWPQRFNANLSWSALERPVQEGEADAALRSAVKHCRSTQERVLASRRLGYRITRIDL